ncbi:unnamed protein product [Rhizoctonia solani]|uniref:Uncharacterized protein n=1 Tax=Rhizoctonia solani TaxID=456999 RepID=A0A8H3C621_9AGAM|nr:unnamed protein product [Rhizoctonia solani]
MISGVSKANQVASTGFKSLARISKFQSSYITFQLIYIAEMNSFALIAKVGGSKELTPIPTVAGTYQKAEHPQPKDTDLSKLEDPTHPMFQYTTQNRESNYDTHGGARMVWLENCTIAPQIAVEVQILMFVYVGCKISPMPKTREFYEFHFGMEAIKGIAFEARFRALLADFPEKDFRTESLGELFKLVVECVKLFKGFGFTTQEHVDYVIRTTSNQEFLGKMGKVQAIWLKNIEEQDKKLAAEEAAAAKASGK